MKRGFVILIIGCVLVIFGFSFFIAFVSEWLVKMDANITTIEGFDYAVFTMGRLGFIIGIIGVIIQAIGGVILFLDKKISSTA